MICSNVDLIFLSALENEYPIIKGEGIRIGTHANSSK